MHGEQLVVPQFAVLVLLTQVLPQMWNPAWQTKPQCEPSQVASAFPGGAHAAHAAPHVATSMLFTHDEPHVWKPVLQLNPHEAPSHVADALAGVEHGAQVLPQLFTSESLTHDAPHRWNPALHRNVQPPLHTGTAFGGAVHATVHEPQWLGSLVVSTQLVPHRVDVEPLHPELHMNTPAAPLEVQTGVVTLQTCPQPLQFAAWLMSVSQPSVRSPLQLNQPGSHMIPQLRPSQLAVEFGREGQTVHDDPHDVTAVLSSQTPLHLWKPVAHTMPHIVPSQLASEDAVDGHTSHDSPQCATLSLLRHMPPQL